MAPVPEELFAESVDPALRPRILAAMAALRIELLGDATHYGLSLLRATGTAGEIPAWREWLTWSLGVMEAPDGDTDSLRALDELERTGPRGPADLATDAARSHWGEMLERLTLKARELEELGTIPLGEVEGQELGAGVRLLGGLEDALALEVTAAADDADSSRPTAADVHALLTAARVEGVWDFLAA